MKKLVQCSVCREVESGEIQPSKAQPKGGSPLHSDDFGIKEMRCDAEESRGEVAGRFKPECKSSGFFI